MIGKNRIYGENGLLGAKVGPDDYGFENNTVGIAGDIGKSLLTQNGILSNDPAVLSNNEPFRTGRFLVKILSYPAFFSDRMKNYLQVFVESNAREVGGIPANSLDRIDVEDGVVRRPSSYPGIYKESGNEISIKTVEYAGSPVRKLVDYWLGGVSDPKTGVAHMYGKAMRFLAKNYTMSFIYILLGPTARPEDIEYACMLHNAMPYAEKTDHLGSTIGDAGSGIEMDIPFAGIFDHKNPMINELAKVIVEAYGLYAETHLNSMLPAYLYEDYMQANADELKNSIGIDLDKRLQKDDVKELYSDAIQDIHKERKDRFVDSDWSPEPGPLNSQ